MAEEVKNTNAAAENAAKEPQTAYSYNVVRLTNGLWDFNAVKDADGNDTIDKYHVALDIIELGRKLEKQMILEEAEARVMNKLNKIAQAQMPTEEASDPTQA